MKGFVADTPRKILGLRTRRIGAGLILGVHWATDVVVGSVVGSAIGVGLPLFLHGRQKLTGVMRAPMTAPAVGLMASGSF